MSAHQVLSKQVLTCYQGSMQILVSNDPAALMDKAQAAIKIIVNGTATAWDSYAMPENMWRSYRNTGSSEAVVLVMSPGDQRKRIIWHPQVVADSGAVGLAMDANGYVADKKFTDRSQR